MAKFLICLSFVALAAAAPSGHLYGHPLGHPGAAALVSNQKAVVGYAAQPVHHKILQQGPATVHQVPRTGVVGHQPVQVGTQTVQVGHQYVHAGTEVHQPAPVSYVAKPATNTQQTVALPPPAIPAPTVTEVKPVKAYGIAPPDTVVTRPVTGLARTHQIITPQETVIQTKIQTNPVPYDVPVAVPVPVEQKVIVDKHVVKPYTVEVPVAVKVPQPYKVHPVHEVVHQPIIHKQTLSYGGHHY